MSNKRDRERRRQRARDRQRQTKQVTGRKGGFSVIDLSKGDRDIEFFKPGKETYVIDFVPFEVTTDVLRNLRDPDGNKIGAQPGDLEYKLEVPVHTRIGPENKSVLCRALAFGMNCFICEQKSGLQWPQDKKEIQALSAQWRNMYNLRLLEPAGKENEVLLWEVAYKTFESEMIDEMREVEAEEGKEIFVGGPENDISSVKFRGVDKTFTMSDDSGKDVVRTFTGFKSFKFIDREEELSDNLLEKAQPLDVMLVIPSYEYGKQLFLGVDIDEDEEQDEITQSERSESTEEATSKRPTKLKNEKDDIPPSDKTITSSVKGWDDLDDMDSEEMLVFMHDQGLKIRSAPRMKERELRKALKEFMPKEKEEVTEKISEKTKGEQDSPCPDGYAILDNDELIFLDDKQLAGENCDAYPICDSCTVWQVCAAAQQELRTQGKIE